MFTRQPEKLERKLLGQLAGSYETPTGTRIQVTYQESSGLSLVTPGAPPLALNQGDAAEGPQRGVSFPKK